MYRQHPSHPCPSFMGQRNHHPPPSSISSIIGFSAKVDLYQLKKPEIFSILVWNLDMAHHCNSPDIWVYEDWICRAWKRIKYMCCILYSGPAQAYIYLSTAYWVVALLRGKHKSPFMGFCGHVRAQIHITPALLALKFWSDHLRF